MSASSTKIEVSSSHKVLVLGIFFSSGAAGLIYEILWMRQLTQLFGSTALSAAVVTSAFFAGLAAGSYYWGRRSRRIAAPLKVYAYLEFGIVIAALFYFLLFQIYFTIFGWLFNQFAEAGLMFDLIKLLLAILLICPATFMMGGTLPLMGQYMINDLSKLGHWAGLLYGVNTLGAVLGAIAAGFFLPRFLGLNAAYGVAMVLSLLIAVLAWLLARNSEASDAAANAATPKQEAVETVAVPLKLLEGLAFFSGFASLAMQVLWIRMLVQVLQNSTYTFSVILVVFLSALAFGALLVRMLINRISASFDSLLLLLVLAGILCLATPFVFVSWTDGLAYLGSSAQLTGYLFEVLSATAAIIGIPALAMGMVLPYLYRFAEHYSSNPGTTLGQLNGWNTLGAVLGPLAAGFVLLPLLGLWNSIFLLGLAYLAIPLVAARNTVQRGVSVAALIVGVVLINPSSLPVVRFDESNERVLQVWEGIDGTVAVVEREGSRRVKLNNWYALGGSGALRMEQIQTHLPMHIHPAPDAVFYLGMGSGITAGTVLSYPFEEAVVAELSAEVIAASSEYFVEFTNGLHDDSRVRVVHADGRNYLLGTDEKFDLIIADLFIPWRSGVGLLYTEEHFSSARDRLNPEGLFVQWVPLYQISERELAIIARTMAEVFPQVTLWRGDFYANQPILAMVGHLDELPLAADTPIVQRSRESLDAIRADQSEQIPLLAYYLGRVEPSDSWLQGAPINTDNLPLIEYLAPESHRAERAGLIEWFTGEQMIQFMQQLQQASEPTEDPYLSKLSPELHRATYAGLFFHIAAVAREEDDNETSADAAAIGRELLIQTDL